jgi:hypothetical protein
MIANKTVVWVLMRMSMINFYLRAVEYALVAEKRGSHASYYDIDTDTDRYEETRLEHHVSIRVT